MSYYTQNNTQQKSAGILFVIGFHILIIWCLLNNMGGGNIPFLPNPVQIKIVEPAPIELPPPAPIEPIIQQSQVVMIKLDNFAVASNESTNTIRVSIDPVITELASTIIKPKIVRASKPDYPAASIRLGEEGATGLRLYITKDGRVVDVELASSSGSLRLDQAAMKHAKNNWKFSPCTEDGVAIACWHQTKLVWKIENTKR